MDVMSSFTADFPNAMVGMRPRHGHQIADPEDPALGVAVDRVAGVDIERQCVQHFTVHIELFLLSGSIAEPHRLRSPIAFEERP